MVLKIVCILVLRTKVASALEGLSYCLFFICLVLGSKQSTGGKQRAVIGKALDHLAMGLGPCMGKVYSRLHAQH